jgi:beta-phosphoglucomutase-like phosphatase (HAD superfamily)
MRDKTPNPKAIIWDFDGTIIEGSEAVYRQATACALAQFGLTQFKNGIPEEIVSKLTGSSSEDVWKYFCENHGLAAGFDDFNAEAGEGLEAAAHEAFAARTLRIRSYVEDSMKAIKALRMRQLIATNGTPEELALLRRILGLTDARLAELGIERIFYATNVKRPKPYPDIYLLAVRGLKLHPSECAAVEDSKTGAIAAACAGMLVIARAERDASIFRSIRAEIRKNPEFWRIFFRNFRGHRGRLRQLYFRNQLFIISPESSPLMCCKIEELRNESFLLANDRLGTRQVALASAAVVKGAIQARKDPLKGRHRRSPI